jgi:uncharacterized protein
MEKLKLLQKYILDIGKEGLCIAFSGGVDSTLLLKVASQVLGDKLTAVTFSSRLSPKLEICEAQNLAKQYNVRHFTLEFDEFEDERILDNPPERCYICKKYIFTKLLEFCRKNELGAVADGTNADDLKQHRPGLRALIELGVYSPLANCGFTKQEVRMLAAELDVTVHNKPSAPCLATRIPYGTRLSDELLKRVEAAEQYLVSLGFKGCRVRAYDKLARLEVKTEEFDLLLSLKDNIIEEFIGFGFVYITLDLEGFRSGSMDLV